MKLNLQLTYENGETRDITCNAADMVAFEDKYNVSIASLSTDPKMSFMLYLAWHSEKRTGGTKDNFEKWLDSVDMVGPSASDPK